MHVRARRPCRIQFTWLRNKTAFLHSKLDVLKYENTFPNFYRDTSLRYLYPRGFTTFHVPLCDLSLSGGVDYMRGIKENVS